MMKAAIVSLFAGLVFVAGSPSHGEESPPEPPLLLDARARYQKQLKGVSDPVKTQYVSYLEALTKTLSAKGDLDGALAVRNEIRSLGLPVGAGNGDKLVIWNTSNEGKGDRGTTKVNVILSANGRVQWRITGVPLEWNSGKEVRNEISIPAVAIDHIRVVVAGLKNGRGGLGEIEFIKDGKNVAKGCPVEVSAVWENDPKHVGKALTDGDPMTSWLLPDNSYGWADISLTTK